AASQATTQAVRTVTTGIHVSTEVPAAATNTTIKHTTPDTKMTAAAITTAATTRHTAKPITGLGNQTTVPKSPTATAMTNTTTNHPGTQTAIPSTMMTETPTLGPWPSSIPTGTYTVSNGTRICIKAVMGLQLMAQNSQKKRMEYMALNPNATQTSGSCGTVQSELNITFSGGFINFTFVK
ncbi:LAMP3 protein, partial [Rhinopomastus cyanomelas]|nr:LAMP3 protein [Rhinopomastus cyanomelas]